MGVFVISPYDKGGRIYAPSKKLRSLTLPDLEPIRYGSLWLWNHENLDAEHAPIHTIVCGAARPSDLDQPAIAAYLHGTRTEEMTEKVTTVAKRLHDVEVEALGEDWVNTWWEGVPNCSTVEDAYQFGQIVSLYNMIKAWGMLDYAKDRYEPFDDSLARWDFDLPTKQNIAVATVMWGYMPGIATEQDKDYSHLFPNISERNPSSDSPSTPPLKSPPPSLSLTTPSCRPTLSSSTPTSPSCSTTRPCTTSAVETSTSRGPPTPT